MGKESTAAEHDVVDTAHDRQQAEVDVGGHPGVVLDGV